MNIQTRKRATARNSSPIKKTFIGQAILLLTLLILSTFIHNYTTNQKEIIDYEEWHVIPGDSLWNIADYYTPKGIDKREVIHEIQQRNDIKGYLQVGQVLEIPIYK